VNVNQSYTEHLDSILLYGFNGMEKDDEWSGNGNSYDFGARIYESRLGRWLAVDPEFILYPYASPYQFALNKPIIFIDVDGGVIFDKDGNKVSIEVSESGSISVTGTNDEALINVIKKTYSQGETGKKSIEKLDAKDVYAEIITHEKKLFLEVETKEGTVVGEVDGISKGEKAGKKERKAVPGAKKKYVIHLGNVSGSTEEVTEENFTSHDVYGDFDIETPYGTEDKKAMAKQAVKDIKNKTAIKTHQEHQESYENLPKEDQELYDGEIAEAEKKDNDTRLKNALIYETANAEAQYDNLNKNSKEAGVSGETAGKKAVVKAYKETKKPSTPNK